MERLHLYNQLTKTVGNGGDTELETSVSNTRNIVTEKKLRTHKATTKYTGKWNHNLPLERAQQSAAR
jgi:hypothetical protein